MAVKKNNIATRLIALAQEKNVTIASAESCTGGWVGKKLTDIPGSSSVYLGGIISYSNEVKHSVLGVPQDILGAYGAVSEQTAQIMASGARELLKSDYAVSITGIAGPGGGTFEKPVGMVCFGISNKFLTETMTKQFGDLGRDKIRKRSVKTALKLLETAILLRN